MKFSLLLWVLGWKLKLSALFSGTFQKTIRHRSCYIVIRTADGARARSFQFVQGVITVRAGAHPEATAELVWRDGATAVAAMLSKNPLDTFSAIGRGELSIQGNLQDALWFSDVAE